MNFLSTYIPESVIKALGWTILHSLWQGLLTALVLAFLLLLLHRQSAAIRYLVSAAAMLTFVLVAIVTFCKEYTQYTIPQVVSPQSVVYAAGFPVEVIANQETIQASQISLVNLEIASSYFSRHLPFIVLIWAVGIAVLLLRFLGGLAYIQRLKYYKTKNLPAHWQQRVNALCEKAHLKQQVRLVESALVKVPIAIGHLKPVILLPVGTVLGLPTEQVEAILAHELAHICRKDYLVNIFQSVAEILFFFHPAIWWISARIREEREHCCDDMALSLCGDSLTFAKALANLENVYVSTPALSLSITGKGSHLLHRIQRLLGQPRRKPDFMEGFLAACILIISLLAVSVSAGTTYNKNPDIPFHTTGKAEELLSNERTSQEDYIDSLKNKDKGTFTYKGTKNGKKYDIKATMEGDEITRLFVDGKKIPSAEIQKYRGLIQELMSDVPVPPAPPATFAAVPPAYPTIKVDKDLYEELKEIDPFVEMPDMEMELEPLEPMLPFEPMKPIEAVEPFGFSGLLREAFENDTTKKKNRQGEISILHEKDNNRKYKIKIKDGEITELEVDGKTIPKEEYKNYQYIVDEIAEDNKKRHQEAMARRDEVRARHEEDRHRLIEMQEKISRDREQAQERMQIERDRLNRKQEEIRIEHEHTRSSLERNRDLRLQERDLERRDIEERNRAGAMARINKDNENRDELIKLITDQLDKDKLIKNKKRYEFKIDSSGLYVNEKKQTNDIFEKYKTLIEKQTGNPFHNYTLQYKIKD
jgi:beta-lactamase regulating signal transducer with metallopeptidase domain